MFVTNGRPRRNAQTMTNYYHYRVELFYTVINMQFKKLNNRFNEVNMELLLCAVSLNPCDSFTVFDKEMLIRLAQFYPAKFSNVEILVLDNQVETYIVD